MKKKIKIFVCPFILLGFIFMLSNSCKKDQAPLAIGDSYQGGIIAYILMPGDPNYVSGEEHGIIAASVDQHLSMSWWNGTNITTGATATALGTGNANTNAIVTAQGAGSYAAKLCADLVLDGQSDWYLPSKNELNKLYINRVAIGGFDLSKSYWSSSESDMSHVEYLYFLNGLQNTSGKDNLLHVRAIRSF